MNKYQKEDCVAPRPPPIRLQPPSSQKRVYAKGLCVYALLTHAKIKGLIHAGGRPSHVDTYLIEDCVVKGPASTCEMGMAGSRQSSPFAPHSKYALVMVDISPKNKMANTFLLNPFRACTKAHSHTETQIDRYQSNAT